MAFPWHTLPKPFFVLAPMEDVTDTVFRQIVIEAGRPDVFVTEFTNIEGIWSVGHEQVSQRLQYTENERPIVAQIWGNRPELYYKTAQKLVELGFDGIDINMGCPVKAVMKQHCGAAMIGHTSLVTEIIDAVRRGAQAGLPARSKGSRGSTGAHRVPLSLKTRIGISRIITEEWIGFLLTQDIDALTIHGRTAAEQSSVPCHWDEIGKAVALRRQLNSNVVIIGNGDVADRADGIAKAQEYGVDGVMIGRGIFHNPWAFTKPVKILQSVLQGETLYRPKLQNMAFSELIQGETLQSRNVLEYELPTHSIAKRLALLRRHIELFEATWAGRKPYQVLKKYFKIYLSGFPGAHHMREELMKTTSTEEALSLIQ